jgi:cyclase
LLAKRIIPCLDIKDGRVVKGVNFLELRDAGDPVEQALVYDAEGADELVFLDIGASHQGRDIVLDVVRGVADCLTIPFTVGGGLRTLDDLRAVLLAGADKVSINTAAVSNPELVEEGARRFGSQCIVVAIDARGRARLASGPPTAVTDQSSSTVDLNPPAWEVYVNGGRNATGLDVVAWARRVAELGAGEILLTSMDADGTQGGYDLDLTRAVAQAVSIPVIASGGAGRLEHFGAVLSDGLADAALAASLFHYRQLSVGQVKSYLRGRGILVR